MLKKGVVRPLAHALSPKKSTRHCTPARKLRGSVPDSRSLARLRLVEQERSRNSRPKPGNLELDNARCCRLFEPVPRGICRWFRPKSASNAGLQATERRNVRSKWFPALSKKRDIARAVRKARAHDALIAKTTPRKDRGCASCKGVIPVPAAPEEWSWPCCSEACSKALAAELDRRAEVHEARRLGMPVATYRKTKAGQSR